MQKMKTLSPFLEIQKTFSKTNLWMSRLWYKELFLLSEKNDERGEETEWAAEQKARCNAGEWDDRGELPFVLLSSKILDPSHRTRSKSGSKTWGKRSEQCFLQESGCSSFHAIQLLQPLPLLTLLLLPLPTAAGHKMTISTAGSAWQTLLTLLHQWVSKRSEWLHMASLAAISTY